MPTDVTDAKRPPVGFEQIAVLTAATGLTPPGNARMALIQAEAQTVRWRDDATDPTATVGMQLAAAAAPLKYVGNLNAIKFIEAAIGGILNVSYYG